MLLKGKNVFLTGGSRGIGKAAVYELVKNGANVAFTYVSSEEGAKDTLNNAKKLNPEAKVSYYKMDVKNSKDVDQTVEKAIKDFGSINVVVNNAGILRDGPIHFMSNEQWDEVIQTHLTGTFYVCRAFIDEFIVNKGGKFINISSICHVGSAGQANYSAAKSGIIGFSKALAKEYGNKDIYCNVIVPGYFKTELTDANASEMIVEQFVRLSMLQREGKPDEFGKAIVFFASDLSSFVNGDVLYVTGGLDTIPPYNTKRQKKKE
ncbi:MAG: SDR family oxidoreductase [Spirochaetes bacterium]|nr:SDR family oxidoreductase [Spirochaetota bacterium]